MKSHQEVAQEQGAEDMARRVAEILFPEPEQVAEGQYVTRDVIDNLEGVIQSLQTRGVNTISLERIMAQIASVRDLVRN